jgi:hypothetical protein
MPTANTDVFTEFYGRPETAPLINEFVADTGGDPDEYGGDDNTVETLVASGLGSALKIFTQRSSELGLINDPAVAVAAGADDVDWNAVAKIAERTLMHGFP